jgi:hypothetical protein
LSNDDVWTPVAERLANGAKNARIEGDSSKELRANWHQRDDAAVHLRCRIIALDNDADVNAFT